MRTTESIKPKTIFWNVDTQYDFMRSDDSFKGALAVPGAREIEGNLERLTDLAYAKRIQVVNTADWHPPESEEFSETPDYMKTFPPHCLENSAGAQYVPATNPRTRPYIIDWQGRMPNRDAVERSHDIVILKDAFDAFKGNPYTVTVVDWIVAPSRVIVYGVATNYCVDQAVTSLSKHGREVFVVKDAIKEIPQPGEPGTTFERWQKMGVKLVTTDEVEKLL